MHKTLYIDVDEEITSIIDRLRKAEASEVIIVSPKNAMLLQSIVNLKLLKKEADRRKKKLLIITQDKIGKKLIEKAGIQAQSKAGKDIYLEADPDEKSYDPMYAEEASKIKQELQREKSEREIGSNEYFEDIGQNKQEIVEEKQTSSPKTKQIKGKKDSQSVSNDFAGDDSFSEAEIGKESKKNKDKARVSMSDIVMNDMQSKKKKTKTTPPKAIPPAEITIKEEDLFSDSHSEAKPEPSKISQVSIRKAEKFFRGARRMKKDLEIAKVGGGAKKYFIFFAGIFALFSAVAAAYFFLPKATLALQVKSQEKPISLDFTAEEGQSGNSDASIHLIPAKLEQLTTQISENYDSTGTKDGGSKATGKAVIYNEFSSEDQPLVATTRLETDDGKIFRITKNTVVPGVTKVGDETKPGAIEVDVIADQPGDSYNIDPTSFRIPGFKNTPSKYEKFYAKSASPMTGGSAGAAKVVTAQDISSAKEKIAADGKKAAVEQLKSSLSPDSRIFDDAVRIELSNIVSSDSAGAEKDKISITADVQISAISFKESDVQNVMRENLVQSGAEESEIAFNKPINYILTDSNMEQKSLKFQAKTDASTAAGLDLENFKKGVLGKTAEEAYVYAKNFPAIQKVDISFWPFFVSRIPMNEKRVEITTD